MTSYLKPGFDRIARPYRWMEYATFGPLLQNCRTAHLNRFLNARRALLFGDGDGRFLMRLLQANPALHADVVDSSRSMLKELDRRLRRRRFARSQVILHHAGALEWLESPEADRGEYDLVVSHFFLDCLSEPQIGLLLERLLPRAHAGARWAISEFSIPSPMPMSYIASMIVRFLYLAFGLLAGLAVRDLPDYAAALRARGFALDEEAIFAGGLLRSELWTFPDNGGLKESGPAGARADTCGRLFM